MTIDYTNEMQFKALPFYPTILDAISVGTYFAQLENGEYLIRHCNKAFAEMYEFENPEKAIGYNMKDLAASPKDYQDIMEAINQALKEGKSLINRQIKAKSVKGKIFTAEVSIRIIKKSREIDDGRVGVVRDVSDELALRDIRNDVGKILHSYSAMLLLQQYAISSSLLALGPDPFKKEMALDLKQASNTLEEPAKNLERLLTRLLTNTDYPSEHYIDAFSSVHWREFYRLKATLRDYKTEIPYPEFRISTLQDVVNKTVHILKEAKKDILPKKITDELRFSVKELGRCICLIILHQANDAILAMDYQIRALREYITFHTSTLEINKTNNINSLISQAIFNVHDFAKNEDVEIRRSGHFGPIEVYGDERSLVRAMINLTHNAIKYSWLRKDDPKWVKIETRIVEGQVWIEFEDYGVAIPKDELDQELCFVVGFRGRLSGERWKRFGTGIGLSDARETARKHGGDVAIQSRPAVFGAPADDYTKPFITTAILKLPLYKSKGG
jgi:PAS domain S-box-containing protein